MEPTQKLIYDRSFKDVQRVAELNRKISAGSASAEEVQEWFSAKGALNYEDLNRIESWTEFLSNQLKAYGYNAPITKRAEQTYTYYEKPEPGDEPVARLPEGYRELTYIESTGTQYIDTGFKPNQDTRLVMDFKLFGGTDSILFGTRASSTLDGFTVFKRASGYWAIQYNDTTSNASVSHDSERHVIDKNKNVAYLDGNAVCTHTIGTFTTPSTLTLLATNDKGNVLYPSNGIIYFCQIYDNGTLIRDFIPCRNPSGDVGLYDTVTKQFFGNAGTGVFKQGEAVVSLPEGYERAHYIESTGTQYVNTGFCPSHNSRVVADVSDVPASSNYIFGTRDDGTTTAPNQFGFYRRNATTIRYDYFGTNNSATVSDTTLRTVIDANANSVTAYGATITNTAVSSGTCSYPMFIFALNSVGSVSVLCSAKLYSCQIYDNGALVRDYIPCKDATGVFGLYDLVEGKFYGNAGTGVFLGTVKRKLPEGYTQVDYIESTGTQYINTEFAPNQDTRVVVDVKLTDTTSENFGLFGARTAKSTDCFDTFTYKTKSVWQDDYGTKSAYADGTLPLTADRILYDKNKNVTTIQFSDGSKATHTHTEQTFTTPCNMVLFSVNTSDAIHATKAKARLYSCQIYDNGTLVRDYVPCVNAQGTAGLYDMENDAFYSNTGTGVFATGEVIEHIENVGGGSNGSTATTITYTDWRVWDIPHLAEITRIRDNVNSLRDGFYNLSDWREIAYKNNPNFEDVNTLEWDMQTIHNWLKLIVLNFKYSGEVYAGEAW